VALPDFFISAIFRRFTVYQVGFANL